MIQQWAQKREISKYSIALNLQIGGNCKNFHHAFVASWGNHKVLGQNIHPWFQIFLSVPEPASEVIDEVTENTSEQAVSVHSEDEEEDLDIFNMKKYARKVTIGQPSTSKDDSDSDSGTKIHKRNERRTEKKDAKNSKDLSRSDILDYLPASPRKQKGKGKGKGKGEGKKSFFLSLL